MKNIPNILSAIRIVLVGLFVYLFLNDRYVDALITFVVAFLTDVLDGYLARRFNWITNVGKLLDPIADKLLVIAALCCILVAKSANPVYLVLFILVLVKETLMIIGGLVMLKKKVVVYSDWYGKTATGLFSLGIVMTLVDIALPSIGLNPWCIGVLIIAVALAYFAMVHYAMTQLNGKNKPKAPLDGQNSCDKGE